MTRPVSTLALAATLLTLPATAQHAPPDVTILEHTGRQSQAWFGQSAEVIGDDLVVGAPIGGGSSGAVYVYRRDGDAWTETAEVRGGAVSQGGKNVRFLRGPGGADDGSLLLSGGLGSGSIYENTPSGWVFRQPVGDRVGPGGGGQALGLLRAPDGRAFAGVAGIDTLIVYTRPPGSAVWERTTCLTDPAGEGLGAPQAAMWLGADGVPALAVKLRGRVAVGVFRYAGGTDQECGDAWTQEATLTPSAATTSSGGTCSPTRRTGARWATARVCRARPTGWW